MAKTSCRVDYFKITMKGGDKGLFGEKLRAISENVNASDREVKVGKSYVNFTLLPLPEGSKLIAVKVFQSRNDNISKRKRGTVSSMPIELGADEDVDETSYFVYCPDTSLVSVAYNYHGPKIHNIVYVVNKLYKEMIDPQGKRSAWSIVQGGTAMKSVMEKAEIRGVTARLKDPSAGSSEDRDVDLPEAFENFEVPKDTTIELTIKSKKRGGFVMKVQEFKKKFLPNANDLELYDVFKVDATDDETGLMRTYDLVKDKLQGSFFVELLDDGKSYNETDMVKKLSALSNGVKEKYTY